MLISSNMDPLILKKKVLFKLHKLDEDRCILINQLQTGNSGHASVVSIYYEKDDTNEVK